MPDKVVRMTSSATTIRHGTLAVLGIMAAAAVFRGNSINYIIGPAATSFGLDGTGTSMMLVAVSVNNAAMNSLPSEHSGAMSSFKGASSAFGSAVTAVLMGALSIGAYEASLSSQSEAAGPDSTTSLTVGKNLNSGLSYSDAGSQVGVPESDVSVIADLSAVALADTLNLKAVLSAVLGLVPQLCSVLR